MVVFQNNHPDKSQYRKFKIKTVAGIDDVAMMREVLYRRFNNNWPKPDLILLSGGTDGGNKEVIISNAELLAGAQINVPVIIAGNKNAVRESSVWTL